VGSHSWVSDNPGAGAGATYIYRFKGLFFTSTDFGLDGPFEGFSKAAEAVNLLKVTDTTERIWVDFRVNPDSGTDDDGVTARFVQNRTLSRLGQERGANIA